LQYGPDDRAIKLKGNANLTFGRQPEVNGIVVATDRPRPCWGPGGRRRRWPIKTLADPSSRTRLPYPDDAEHYVENVTSAVRCSARAPM
jgi:hypothetical protein